MEFQQPFTAYSQKNKAGFHRNFGLKRQVRAIPGLFMLNIAEREQEESNLKRVNPKPVNGYEKG